MYNDEIFSTSDPLNRNIILKSTTWNDHIKPRHNECDIDAIKTNIENPTYILVNTKPEKDGSTVKIVDNTRQDYIGLTIIENKLHVIKTIVEFENCSNGCIVTNHILRKANEINTIGGVIYDRCKDQNTTEFINL